MATYAIGDIQGCFQTFQALLKKIKFNASNDQLWLAGDLINRGSNSLETLQFVYTHRHNIRCVLGNHDLHFLAVEAGQRNITKADTFDDILSAPNRKQLAHWLCQQPLFIYDQKLNFAMVHAGVPFNWSLQQMLEYSDEVSNCLKSSDKKQFFSSMYGNLPSRWSNNLLGLDRLRYITNVFTRMRYCDANSGALELETKSAPGNQAENLVPWFDLSASKIQYNLVFGHWASLQGKCIYPQIYSLDTGCVWGSKLTALRLEDKTLFQCDSVEQ